MTTSVATKPRRRSAATYRLQRRLKKAAMAFVLLIVLAYTLFPYYWAIVSSTKQGAELYTSTLLPALDFSAYIDLIHNPVFMGSLVNSTYVAVCTTAVSLVLGVTAAYALGRIDFPQKRLVMILVLMVSIFPQVAVLSGMFELINWMGLFNNPTALIFTYLISTVPFTTWILTTFMREFPRELEEAAIIDGCSHFRILTKILLPLLGPSLASTGILAFILSWNEFLFALTFMLTDNNKTVPVAIGLIAGNSRFEYPFGQIMAASVTVTLPLIIIVLIFQRRIVAGLTAGAIKG
ncbi:carbohydrate ABC transporter permease [Martelella endophytica]|uniref:Sugar ABC transporter permease n=1 Tax=Martelella endophytica TaxID=1486262 RepID=A0A0D5LNY4_MAREN|nr:carbohydrate ABC transporter permease [Martelella endophytica]AJY45472.1 sugar ABC transporter permease [Martelella endophytica]